MIAGIIWLIQGKPKGKKMLLVSVIVVVLQVVVRAIVESSRVTPAIAGRLGYYACA